MEEYGPTEGTGRDASLSRYSCSGPLVLPLLRGVPLQTALTTPFASRFWGLTQASAGPPLIFSLFLDTEHV